MIDCAPPGKRWRARVAFPLICLTLAAAPLLERLVAGATIVLFAADALAQSDDSTGTAVRKPHAQKRPRQNANDAMTDAPPANTPSGHVANNASSQNEQDVQVVVLIVAAASLVLVLIKWFVVVRRKRTRGGAKFAGTSTGDTVAMGDLSRHDASPAAPSAAPPVMAQGPISGHPGSSSFEGTLATSSWTLAGMAPERLAHLEKSHIVGKVTHFDVRTEAPGRGGGFYNADPQNNKTVWNFRVEAGAGSSSEQIYSVEMRAKFFNGAIKNGDVVAFEKKHFRRGRVTELRSILNVSGGEVDVRAE